MDEETIERTANAIATLVKNSQQLKVLTEQYNLLLARFSNLVGEILGVDYPRHHLLSDE